MNGLNPGALGMALGGNDPSKWGGKPPMATCTGCGEPLVGTMRWAYYQFVCVCCGRHLGYCDPAPVESTPEVEARQAELEAAFTKALEDGVDLDEWLAERVAATKAAS